MELIKIGVMNLGEAKELETSLAAIDVELVLNHNESTCSRGCSVTVEIHAKESDLPKVAQVYQERFSKMLEGHDFDPKLLDAVFDPSVAEAQCPACGHTFSTQLCECPDCGLNIG